MTDADSITNHRDRFGRRLDQLNRIDQLNLARIFLDATALLLETLGRIQGLNSVLANLNAADAIVAEIVGQLEAEWDAARPG